VHGLGISLAYDSRLLYRNPRAAWWLGAGVTWFGGALQGTVDYTHYFLDVRRYQPVPVGRTLGLHVRLIRRAGQVPEYRLVRLGGQSTVRGYHSGELEGLHGALAAVEYRFDLVESRSHDLGPLRNFDLGLSAALFLDAGVTWNDDDALTWEGAALSGGGGLRFFLPFVEVLRVDLALTRTGAAAVEVGAGMMF
jgi:outer membrane protein assembly factor BamA